jgi:type 1 glutamine amidotransferase
VKRILYVFGGPDFHPTEVCGTILSEILQSDGRFELDVTCDLDAFASLPGGKYAAVVVYTTGLDDQLTPAREQGLLEFVEGGGGFLGIHSAVASFQESERYIRMMNGRFLTDPAEQVAPHLTVVRCTTRRQALWSHSRGVPAAWEVSTGAEAPEMQVVLRQSSGDR